MPSFLNAPLIARPSKINLFITLVNTGIITLFINRIPVLRAKLLNAVATNFTALEILYKAPEASSAPLAALPILPNLFIKAINGCESFTIASLIRTHASLKFFMAGALFPRPVLIVIINPVIKRNIGAISINVAFNFIPTAKALTIVFVSAWKAPLNPLTNPKYEVILIINC